MGRGESKSEREKVGVPVHDQNALFQNVLSDQHVNGLAGQVESKHFDSLK